MDYGVGRSEEQCRLSVAINIMFITKKRFESHMDWVRLFHASISNLFVSMKSEVDEARQDGDDALSGIIVRHHMESLEQSEALSKIVERHHKRFLAACDSTRNHDVKIEERLREAETRIDNLIESLNGNAAVHIKNTALINENIDQSNERFAAQEEKIAILEGNAEGYRVVSASERKRSSEQAIKIAALKTQLGELAIHQTLLESQNEVRRNVNIALEGRIAATESCNVSPSAIYFHYTEGLAVGLTYWLKVECLPYKHSTATDIAGLSHETIQGTWDGSLFVLPDGETLSHESVIEVGDIIETPEL